MVKTKNYSLREQTVYLFIGKIVAFFFAFISPIIVTRLFSQEEYGFYRQLLLFGLILEPILVISIPNSLYYFFPIQENNILSGLGSFLFVFCSKTQFGGEHD